MQVCGADVAVRMRAWRGAARALHREPMAMRRTRVALGHAGRAINDARQASARPAQVNPTKAATRLSLHCPLAAADATIGLAVESNRFIRRLHAWTSFILAWAADKRYSLGASMQWVTSLENPQAVISLFGDAGEFSNIELHEVTLGREGPVVRLRFDVPLVPSRIPSKWPAEANTTQFVLAAWGVGALQVAGWAPRISGHLSVSRQSNESLLVFAGASCRIEASFGFLRIERVTGYVNVESA